jgi:hypothetical protein
VADDIAAGDDWKAKRWALMAESLNPANFPKAGERIVLIMEFDADANCVQCVTQIYNDERVGYKDVTSRAMKRIQQTMYAIWMKTEDTRKRREAAQQGSGQ